MAILSIIVAAAKNGVIGREGDLPWRLSADLRRFKRITMGHPIVMGRKTWDSIGKPLPGRSSVVVTRQEGYCTEFEEVHVVHTLEDAIEVASSLPGGEETYLIGGAQLYEAALPLASKLYFTHVEAEVEGDATFPAIDWSEWKQVEAEKVPADEKNDHAHMFSIYHRK
ncbi:MAG: dihydrofolate reductase [Lacipirellulaceae bacterium]